MINLLLRPGGPPIQSHFPDFTTPGFTRVRNQVIMRKLDQPIPFHFPEETPLEDVLKYIRDGDRGCQFPRHTDLRRPDRPAERRAEPELDGADRPDAIPVRDGLRLCLKQLDLGFSVR